MLSRLNWRLALKTLLSDPPPAEIKSLLSDPPPAKNITSAAFEAKVREPPPKPLDGYLVAAVPLEGTSPVAPPAPVEQPASADAAADPAAELDGPPSTDSEEDDIVDGQALSFANGRRAVRESSFRKRSDDKIARAKIISSSLASHLVTPAIHARRLATAPEEAPEPAPPSGSRTVGTTARTLNSVKFDAPTPQKDGDSFRRRRAPGSSEKKLKALDKLAQVR